MAAKNLQTDIKKVLAYSTVSQLGYMFLGLGVGAYTAAFFHVITHGKGRMYPHGSQVNPEERWKIAMYVATLQNPEAAAAEAAAGGRDRRLRRRGFRAGRRHVASA